VVLVPLKTALGYPEIPLGYPKIVEIHTLRPGICIIVSIMRRIIPSVQYFSKKKQTESPPEVSTAATVFSVEIEKT
jgi:hypothetical protein